MLAIAPLGAWPRLEPCIHPRPFPYFKGDVRVTLLLGGKAEGEGRPGETKERGEGTQEGKGKEGQGGGKNGGAERSVGR